MPSSIRARLLWLVAIAMVPVLAVVAWGYAHETQRRRAEAQYEVLTQTRMVAGRFDDLVASLELVLSTTQMLATADLDDIAGNNERLRSFVRGSSLKVSNVWVVDRSGRIVASSSSDPLVQGQLVDDRDYFRRALTEPGMVVSRPFEGRHSQHRLVAFSKVVRNAAAEARAVVVASLDLGEQTVELSSAVSTSGARVVVFDRSGAILLSTDPHRPLALDMSTRPSFARALAEPEFVVMARMNEGGHRIAAYVKTRNAPWIVSVAVGLDRLDESHWQTFRFELAGLIALLILTMIMALLMARSIIRPLRKLSYAVRRAAGGDLTGRADALAPSELTVVIDDFHRMAERLAAQNQHLAEAEQRWTFALDAAELGVWEYRTSSDRMIVTPSWRALYKMREQDSADRREAWRSCVHPSDRARVAGEFARLDRGELTTLHIEYRALLHDGSEIWVEDHARVAEAADTGRAERVVGLTHDITKRREAEGVVRASERMFGEAFDSAPQPTMLIDFDTERIVRANRAAGTFFRCDSNDLVGRTTAELHLWFDVVERARVGIALRARGAMRGMHVRLRAFDGCELRALSYETVTEIGGRRLVLTQTVDLTDFERSERERAVLADRLKVQFDRMPIGCITFDSSHRIQAWNPTAERIFGWTAERMAGSSPFSFLVDNDGEAALREMFDRMRAGELETQALLGARCADGRMILCEWHNTPLFEAEQPIGFMSMVLDVTERERAREALQDMNSELERRVVDRTTELRRTVNELEAFTYTVSHDLRAPLRAIDGFSSIVSREHANTLDTEGRRLLDRVSANAKQMAALIDGLLEFSRMNRTEVRMRSVDMHGLVQAVIAEAEEISSTGATFEIGALPAVWGDAALLKQVVRNLIDNAVKFSAKAPAPRIEVFATDDRPPVFVVRDNGVGFDPRYVDRLFGVFQRLHSANDFEGTGAGLAIVRRIVERHGGRVWAESTPGQGTTFRFVIGERHGNPAG